MGSTLCNSAWLRRMGVDNDGEGIEGILQSGDLVQFKLFCRLASFVTAAALGGRTWGGVWMMMMARQVGAATS
ncbi:hypothetical protein Dimus_003014 [Dionaea muscipula]